MRNTPGTIALIVLIVALIIGVGHPDLTGLQSAYDSLYKLVVENWFSGLLKWIGGILKAAGIDEGFSGWALLAIPAAIFVYLNLKSRH